MKQKKGFVNFWTVTIAILLALVVWRVVIVWQFNRASGDSSATMQGAGERSAAGSIRRLDYSLPALGDLAQVDAMASEPGCRIDLDRAIAALPDPQRLALLLSALAEMSHAEIARATGWPLGTVK